MECNSRKNSWENIYLGGSEKSPEKNLQERSRKLVDRHKRAVLQKPGSIFLEKTSKLVHSQPLNRFSGQAQHLPSAYRNYQTILCCIAFLTLGLSFILAGCMRYDVSMIGIIALAVLLGIGLSSLFLLGLSGVLRSYIHKRQIVRLVKQKKELPGLAQDYMAKALTAAENGLEAIERAHGKVDQKITKKTLEEMIKGIILTRISLDMRLQECANIKISEEIPLKITVELLKNLERYTNKDLIGVAAEAAVTVAVKTTELGVRANVFIDAKILPQSIENLQTLRSSQEQLQNTIREVQQAFIEFKNSTEELAPRSLS